MRASRRYLVASLLLAATACAGPGPSPDRVAVAAGAGAQVIPEPTTTTTTVAPAPTTTTTKRPPATTTSTARPAPPATTAAPAPRPRGPYPPGVSGTTLSATTTSGSTTLSLKLFPGDQYFGEIVQVSMELSTRNAVRSVKVDFGNGHVVDASHPGITFNCPGTVRSLNPGAPIYTYPAPGRYVVRAIVTEAPCVPFPATPPPGFPSEVPDPFSPDRVIEVSLTFEQAPDRPPRPVGPPPGA